jgi:hypothetical protein
MYIKNYTGWRKIYEDEETSPVDKVVSTLDAFGELKKGTSEKNGALLLQTLLKNAGKLTGTTGPAGDGIDGNFGPGTESALVSLIGKTAYSPAVDSGSLKTEMTLSGKDFSNTLTEWQSIKAKIFPSKTISAVMHKGVAADDYGKSIGITDKTSVNFQSYKTGIKLLSLPASGPIGNIEDSAWANLNVPTRGIPDTQNGNVGCAAAVSIIFYRATGLPIIKGRTKSPVELGTSALWTEFTKTNRKDWLMITNWETEWKPGDIILTSRGSSAGHVGVVVEGGKVISNSSRSFAGDKLGQIELNYTMPGVSAVGINGSRLGNWESIANRNPLQTACFRYQGGFLNGWGGQLLATESQSGTNDEAAIQAGEAPANVIVNPNPTGVIPPIMLDPNMASPADTIHITNPTQLNILINDPNKANDLFIKKN